MPSFLVKEQQNSVWLQAYSYTQRKTQLGDGWREREGRGGEREGEREREGGRAGGERERERDRQRREWGWEQNYNIEGNN